MLKKFLNVFVCLVLIIQSFLVVIPVMASENDLIEYFDVELIYTNFENSPNIYNENSYWYNYDGEDLYEVKTRYYNVESKYLTDEKVYFVVKKVILEKLSKSPSVEYDNLKKNKKLPPVSRRK